MKKLAPLALAVAALFLLAGCGKPSEADVHSALVKLYTEQGGGQIDQATANKLADCMAPKLEDKVSASGLNNLIKDGVDAKGSSDDEAAVEQIVKECQDVLKPAK